MNASKLVDTRRNEAGFAAWVQEQLGTDSDTAVALAVAAKKPAAKAGKRRPGRPTKHFYRGRPLPELGPPNVVQRVRDRMTRTGCGIEAAVAWAVANVGLKLEDEEQAG